MRGINLFESAHFVNAIPPINGTGGVTGVEFSMKNWAWANILLKVGVSAAAATKILVEACTDASGAGAVAIPFSCYSCETDGSDVFGAREAVTAAGKTPSANNNIMYGLFVDAAELPDDKPYVRVRLTNGTNSFLVDATAILTGFRYGGTDQATVIT